MADRTLTVRIGANVSGYVASLKTMAGATKDAASQAQSWTQKHKDGINEVSSGLLKGGLVLTGFAALAVKKFADFDAAMSGVGAATMETAENMGLLRAAALDAGAATQYSASEAAGAITALAKAGVQTTDILKGGLTGALNLAASEQMNVAQAAEITATALNQYGLKGKDASHVSDLLAASAGKAMGGVTDMAGALKFVGPVAHQMGISIEETAGTIAYLAQQGVLGEQAGTSLRGMLTALTSPSKIAAKEMKALGINVYDANGQFVGFNGVAQQLKSSMVGLTSAERDQSFGRIFGNEQITTARLLYQGGAAAIDTWTESVNDSGYAAEQARIKTDNLKGDIERLGGAIDTALIQGGSGANDALRNIAQGAETLVNKIGELPAPLLNATTLLAGSGGLALLGVGALGKLAVSVSNTKLALDAMKVSMKTAGIAAGALGGALAIGTIAFMAWADASARAAARDAALRDSLDQSTGAISRNTRETIANDLAVRQGWWLFKKESATSQAKILGLDLDTLTDAILGNKDAILAVDEATTRYQHNSEGLSAAAKDAGIGILDYANAQRTVREEVDALTDRLGVQIAEQKDVIAATGESADATDENRSALEKYAAAQSSGTAATEDYVDALKEQVDAQREAAGVVLDQREAQRRFEQATRDATKALADNGKTLDITTEAGSANQAALDGIVVSGEAWIDNMRKAGASQVELQATMQATRERFLAAAEAFGMSADEANALADAMELIPERVDVQVAADTTRARLEVEALITTLNNRVATIKVRAAMPDVPGVQRMGAASGGFIAGPGTGTSDSIPAYLSNGEYVIRASAVARYGRHFFDNLNAQRFATGGMVALRPAPASVSFAASGGGRAAGGDVYHVDNVTIPAQTVRDFTDVVDFFSTVRRQTRQAVGVS